MKVLPDYIFIGVARRDGNPKKIRNLLDKNTKVSLYTNADKEIVIIRHRSHLEKLLLLVSSLDKNFRFEFSLFGCELQGLEILEKSQALVNLLFISPRGKLSSRLLEEEVGKTFGQLFRMLGERWVLLYAMNTAIRQDPLFKTIQKSSIEEIIGLTRIRDYTAKSFELYKKRSKYDSIRAKTRELAYQLAQAESFITKELQYLKREIRSSQRAKLRALNHRYILIKKLLDAEKAKIEEASRSLNPSLKIIEKSYSVLKSLGSVINTMKLDPYSQQSIRGQVKTTRSLLESVEILNVEDAFALDAHNALGLTGLCPIVIPSRDYNCRVVNVVGNFRIIELPITISPRLGLLPIIYHLISHQAAEDMVRRQIVTLSTLKKIVGPFLRNTKNDFCKDRNSCIITAREVLADLIASEIAGPAYLYALSRAFPFEQKSGFDGDQELMIRLKIVFNHLCEKGFSLNSDSLQMGSEEQIATIPENISELISIARLSFNYSQDVHKSVLVKLKPALIAGEVIPIKPSLVANALWDAVLDGKSYLNENAAFLSVLNWIEQREAYLLS